MVSYFIPRGRFPIKSPNWNIGSGGDHNTEQTEASVRGMVRRLGDNTLKYFSLEMSLNDHKRETKSIY